MADLCTCQRPGVEAAAREVYQQMCPIPADGPEWAALAPIPERIRAILTTPGQPCPRCEVVAAGERYALARDIELALHRQDVNSMCEQEEYNRQQRLRQAKADVKRAHRTLLRAIERMRS